MARELALILEELLIKQDETTTQVRGINLRLDETNTILNQTVVRLDETAAQQKETNSILKDFMGVSVKQWEQQQKFNEIFAKELTGIKGILNAAIQLETRVKAVEDRENDLERRLSHVEKLLKAS